MTHQEVFRQNLIEALRRELIGPPWSVTRATQEKTDIATEILQESPVQRYSAGVLFPSSQPIIEVEDTDVFTEDDDTNTEEVDPDVFAEEEVAESEREGRGNDAIGDVYDQTVRLANEFFPAAIGLTCIARIPDCGLLIRPRAAVYESKKPADPNSKLREWHRSVLEIAPAVLRKVPGADHGIRSFELAKHLKLQTIYSSGAKDAEPKHDH